MAARSTTCDLTLPGTVIVGESKGRNAGRVRFRRMFEIVSVDVLFTYNGPTPNRIVT